jgi:hypothetical protein
MREEGKRKILAVLFVLAMIGSFVAIINNFDFNEALRSAIQSNPIQSVGVEINEVNQSPTGGVSASPYFVGSKKSNVYHYP